MTTMSGCAIPTSLLIRGERREESPVSMEMLRLYPGTSVGRSSCMVRNRQCVPGGEGNACQTHRGSLAERHLSLSILLEIYVRKHCAVGHDVVLDQSFQILPSTGTEQKLLRLGSQLVERCVGRSEQRLAHMRGGVVDNRCDVGQDEAFPERGEVGVITEEIGGRFREHEHAVNMVDEAVHPSLRAAWVF